MEKKNFVTLIMAVVGGMLFSLGMCMCLLPEWNMFNQGVVLGAIGAVVLLATWLVYRRMHGKKVKLNAKVALKGAYGIISALVFGTGMCLVMAFEGMMLYGILVGIVGIVMLLFLIPMCVGFKKSESLADMIDMTDVEELAEA